MTKVHPNVTVPVLEPQGLRNSCSSRQEQQTTTMTVWRKSLLFNCSGFTVFDSTGNLIYRVDNYASESPAEVVLMDATGRPVVTVRRKKLSLGDQWLIFDREEIARPLCAVKRHLHVRSSKSIAHVAPCAAVNAIGSCSIEGSYVQRCCTVYDEHRRAVAEVQRKESVGADVFKLVVQPGMDVSLAMAVVVALDQMFGSKPSLLRSWSWSS